MTVLDANVVIGFLDPDDALHADAVRVVRSSVAAGAGLTLSSLTLAEVLVVPARAGELHTATEALRVMRVLDVGWPSSGRALAQVRADTGLRLPDAAVLLTAEERSEPLATFDQRLADAARSRGVPVLED